MKKIIINIQSLLPVIFWVALGSSVLIGAGYIVHMDLTLPHHGGVGAAIIDSFFGAFVASLFFGIGYYDYDQITLS